MCLDERYLLKEEMTLDRIASTIVHEATHARLERWGIIYEEESRYRIEAICLRRELNYLAKLPDSGPLQEEIARTLEWCATDRDHLSDASFRDRDDQGQVDGDGPDDVREDVAQNDPRARGSGCPRRLDELLLLDR